VRILNFAAMILFWTTALLTAALALADRASSNLVLSPSDWLQGARGLENSISTIFRPLCPDFKHYFAIRCEHRNSKKLVCPGEPEFYTKRSY
jgi:hypothetical protein